MVVSDSFLGTGVDLPGGRAPYGDSSTYVSTSLINPNTGNSNNESHFNASSEFQLSELTHLRLLGVVTSKANIVVGQVYPRF